MRPSCQTLSYSSTDHQGIHPSSITPKDVIRGWNGLWIFREAVDIHSVSFVTLSGQETPITRHRYRLMILNENTGNLGFVNFYIQFDLIHLLLQICNSTEDWKGCKKQFRNETINAGGFTPLKHVDGNSGFCLEEQCVPYAVVLSIRERDSKGSDTIENCIDMLLRSLQLLIISAE